MRKFEERELPQLLDLLYDAALDPERWPTFLNGLPAALGAACGVMHDFDIASATLVAFKSFGSDPAYIVSYGAYYGHLNPYPKIRGFESIPVGKPFISSDLFDGEVIQKVVQRSEFYNDWMKPQGITTDHLAVSLANGQGKVTVLSIAPHASVYRKDRKTYQCRLELLVPHLVRAVAINRAAVRAQRAESALATGLDALSLAAFMVGENGQVLLANGGAEELLRRERVLTLDRSRRLSAADPAAHRSFAAAIAQAFLPLTTRIAPPVRLTSQESGRAFVAWALPMRPTQPQEPNQRVQMAGERDGGTSILVLVVSADRALSIPAEVIQAAFKLSAAEARLASALVAGRSLAEYARASELSRNTARNQLTSTLEKTGLHRQAELVTLIAGTLGTLSRR
jgi:DNA-binding CsgD family transcriptional regulator/PAS domain-containing protein